MAHSPPQDPGRDDAAPLPLRFPSLRFEEPFQGSNILEELPMHIAMIVWEVHRDLHKWTLASRSARRKLFQEGAAAARRAQIAELERLDPLLRDGLEVTCEILDGSADASPARVARACELIAAWAEERKAPYTRFWFIMHAATCAESDPILFYRAACIARDAAWWDAAEVNFDCAIASAKRARNRQAQVMALLGWGNMHIRQASFATAEEMHLEARKLARKHGFRALEGSALHNLFVISTQLADLSLAEQYAQKAVAVYGPGHEALPALAHDICYFWNRTGRHCRALPVLKALLPRLHEPADRFRAITNLGHSAGVCGDAATYRQAWAGTWQAAASPSVYSALSSGMLELAFGAARLGEWDDATRAAREALAVAQRRAALDVAHRAEELLREVEEKRQLPRPVVEERTIVVRQDMLVSDLIRALEGSAAA